MMRLDFLLFIVLLVRQTDAFRPIDCIGRSLSIRDPTRQVRNWGIIFALDDADMSLEGDFSSFMDDNAEEAISPVPMPAAPEPKKKAPKRKPKASVAAPAPMAAIAVESAPETATAPVVPAPVEAPIAPPATVPSKIYYRAKEDNEIYAVSSISIDSNVTTLKDLKKLLVDANEWPESSRVIFYSGDERLAFTTALSECLLDNTSEKPLSVTVITGAAISEAPVVYPEEIINGKSTLL